MKQKLAIPGLIIICTVFLLYGNTLKNSYALDDVAVYTGNKYTTQGVKGIPTLVTNGYWFGFSGSNDFVYRPLPLLVFALEYEMFKENPRLNHLINIIFYGISCLVLFIFLTELFKEHKSLVLPYTITLLYLAHPIHTESVANVKGLDEILGFLFGTLSLLTVLKFLSSRKSMGIMFLLLSAVLFLLGLFSKESVITFLAVIPIMLILYKTRDLKKITISILPFVAATLIYFIIRAKVLDTVSGGEMDLTANTLTGAKNYADHLATVFYLIIKYLLLLIFPHPLSFDYSFNHLPVISFKDGNAIFSLLMLAAMAVYIIINWRKILKNKIEETHRNLMMGLLYFFITLSVASNIFVLVGATFAERFVHTPSLGFCFMLATALIFICKINTKTAFIFKKNLLFLVLLSGILIGYSFKTYNRNKVWKDNFTLYETDLKVVPNSARAQLFYGIEMLNKYYVSKNKNQLAKAIEAMEHACRINPGFYHAFYNLGLAYQANDDHKNAVKVFERVLEIEPKHINTHYYLGMSYGKGFNLFDKAIEYIEKGIKYGYNGTDGYVNLGISYAMKGDFKNAIASFEKGITISPDNANLYLNLGITYDNTGEKEKAKSFYEKAFALDPSLKK